MMQPASSLPSDEHVAITDASDVIIAQRRTRLFAERLGFDRPAAYSIATAVSEAATNILKYGKAGSICLRAKGGPPLCLVFEARDRGGGIANLAQAMRDGVSEGRDLAAEENLRGRRGLGCGLGAIQRLMHRVQITSSAEGTLLCAERDLDVR